MSKEQEELLDEAYKNFVKWVESSENQNNKYEIVKIPVSKEIFIKTIKGDDEIVKKMGKRYCDEFSQNWGLQIEERELNTDERNKWFQINLNGNNPLMKSDWKDYELDQQNIPTKLITITYNDKTIESYES